MSICENCKELNELQPTHKVARCTTNKMGLHHSYNDKPSLVWEFGTELWHMSGEFHRKDKPAIISRHNNESPWALGWWKNGKKHRALGKPSFICTNGVTEWATDGVIYRKILPPPGVSYIKYPLVWS